MSAVIVSFLYSLCMRYLTMEDTASSLLQKPDIVFMFKAYLLCFIVVQRRTNI